MVEALTKDATANWAEFGSTGKPLTQKKLATCSAADRKLN
jgi:hypothetical protein